MLTWTYPRPSKSLKLKRQEKVHPTYSSQQKRKFEGKGGGTPHVTTTADKKKCGWCALAGHGGKPTTQTRREKVKAFNHKCVTCSGIRHYWSMCRSKKIEKALAAMDEEVQVEGGQILQPER